MCCESQEAAWDHCMQIGGRGRCGLTYRVGNATTAAVHILQSHLQCRHSQGFGSGRPHLPCQLSQQPPHGLLQQLPPLALSADPAAAAWLAAAAAPTSEAINTGT